MGHALLRWQWKNWKVPWGPAEAQKGGCKVQQKFVSEHTRIAVKRAPITAGRPRLPLWLATPSNSAAFRARLESQLIAFCSKALKARGGAIAAVHSADFLLKIETDFVNHEGELITDQPPIWALAVSGNDQAGAVPFRLNTIQCTPLAIEAEATVLRLSRRAHVPTRRSLPFGGEVTAGVFEHASVQDLAAIALDASRVPEEASALRVRIRKMGCARVLGDRLRVLGESIDVHPLVVEKDPLDGPPGPPPVGDDDVAWDKGVLPPPKKRAKGGGNSAGVRRGSTQSSTRPAALLQEAEQEVARAVFGDFDCLPEGDPVLDMLREAQAEVQDDDVPSGGEGDEPGSSSEEEGATSAPDPPRPRADESAPDASSSGASHAPAQEDQQPAEAMPEVTPGTCIEALRDVHTRAGVFAVLPGFAVSPNWVIVQTTQDKPIELAKVRTIVGNSFRADCKRHPGCKFHLSVWGKFEWADAAVTKWAIAGSTMTATEHTEAGIRAIKLFKAAVAGLNS